MQHVGAGLVEQGRIHLVADVDGRREEVLGPEADAALLPGKVALDAEAVHAGAALAALQQHLVAAVVHEALQPPQIGELVAAEHPAAGHKTLVVGVVEQIGHVVVQHGVVGIEAAVEAEFAAVEAGKHAAAVGVFAANVGVGHVLYTGGLARSRVALGCAHRLDGARGVARKGREIEVGALHEGAVAQLVVVGVFGLQRGLAGGHDERVRLLRVGVQELQRGALDAAVVGQLEHVAVGQLAREVHAGHGHAVVGDGHGLAVVEIGRNDGVLVAQAGFQGEAPGQAQRHGGVGGGYVLAVVEAVVQPCADTRHELAVGPRSLEVAVVAIHAAQNVLAAELQNLVFGQRGLVVGLHREFLVGAGVFVAQARRIGIGAEDAVGEVVGAVVAAVQGQQAELLLGLLEGVGVVQAGVHGARVVAHVHVAHRVAVGQRRQAGEPVLIGVLVAGPVRERGRERVVLVDVIVPAQHPAAKRLVLAGVGRLRRHRGRAAVGVPDGLHVRELARHVVARPAEAAQVEAHLAGAVAAVQAEVAAAGARAGIHAQGAAAQVIAFGDDVDDAARALRVVLGRGRGDDFHGLNLVGRNLLQRVGDAGGGNGRGLVVDEHLDVARTAQAHVAVEVHAQQRHALEHVGGVAALGRLVVFGVVHRAVHALLNQGFLGRHHHLAQLLGRSRQGNAAQGRGLAGRDRHAGPRHALVAQKAHLHRVAANRNAGQYELAVVAGHAAVHGLAGRIEHGHRGVRNRLAGGSVGNRAGDAAGRGARGVGENGPAAGRSALLGVNDGWNAHQRREQRGRSR